MIHFDKLKDQIIKYIDQNVSKKYTYHQAWHTLEVMENVRELGSHYQLDSEQQLLLDTAALLHDVGYADTVINHEDKSCNYATKILPYHGYSMNQIDTICTMIMATKLPQKPKDFLSEILCDADLLYLAGDDYNNKASLLYNELKSQGTVDNRSEWIKIQINFLKNHTFFTSYSINKVGDKIEKYIQSFQSKK
jgi:predicted metal-dependent HD superfamily phosphohydrolase